MRYHADFGRPKPNAFGMKKALRETQTLRAGCSKAVPKISPRRRSLPGGMGRPKFNQLEMVTTYLYLQTQFGEDRCTQFRVIVVTDPQTNKHSHKPTNRQHRLQYTAPQLARSVINMGSPKMEVLTPRPSGLAGVTDP